MLHFENANGEYQYGWEAILTIKMDRLYLPRTLILLAQQTGIPPFDDYFGKMVVIDLGFGHFE